MLNHRSLFTLLTAFCCTVSFLCTAESTQQQGPDFSLAAERDIPAVVSIQVKAVKAKNSTFSRDSDYFSDDFFQQFFSWPQNKREKGHAQEVPILGQASGFLVSPDGYILTNSHVVSDASEIDVILNDGREFKGKMIGQDPNTEIAVVKIEGKDLPFLKLGNSDALKVGQWVAAVGTPLGLQASLTVGVVSAKGRNNLDLTTVEDFIQTDAAINRGNSGGPLLNLAGEVIGINTAIVTNNDSGGYMGIGFAVPSNIAKNVMDQLIKSGSVTRGYIGVMMQNIDQDLAQAFGLKQPGGALVAEVSKGSPAEKAGIKQGDVIQAYNKQNILNIGSLRTAIALMTPGTRVSFTVLRNGKSVEIPIEIGNYPSSVTKIASSTENKMGFEVQDLTPEVARTLGMGDEKGVVITKVEQGSPAAWAGLKKGNVILSVNQNQITSVAEFNAALKAAVKGKPVLLLIRQGEHIRYLSLKMD